MGSEAAGGGEKLEPIVLTDILGSEDALGDMDFKAVSYTHLTLPTIPLV